MRSTVCAECECACDDYVVHQGTRRSDYAQQLVELARSLRAAGLTAAVPLTRKNTLEQRIKALFDDGRSHRLLGSRPAMTLLAGALILLTSLAAVHPGTSEVQTARDLPLACTGSDHEQGPGRTENHHARSRCPGPGEVSRCKTGGIVAQDLHPPNRADGSGRRPRR